MEILIVLGLPLLGAVLLALFGARRFAAELNAGMSLATLLAAALLVLRVIRFGPMLLGGTILRRSVQRFPCRAHRICRLHYRAVFPPLHAH